ncbi:ABC transporter substrate-binding protein [Gorillibacterium sp. sgz500922]|uniref:ABC transporter substrate-binding protein n=1 Tax=Gorillibacterium sp. sgz500922 TaxID=3446694 RepID=UPI003F663C17
MKRSSVRLAAGICALALAIAGCGQSKENGDSAASSSPKPELKDIQVVLDWTPNTNHTGLYVAKEKGFYEQHGLNVSIIQPGEAGADSMVASGEVQFGIGYQEGLTFARTEGVPLVSLAAIIQHNTSGFAAPVAKNIKSPKDFAGKTYGGFGGPSETAILQTLMEADHADPSTVKVINIGSADYFTAVKRDVDFSWIYYGWTGIEAQLRGEPLDMIYLKDFSPKLDYYTPLLLTNEKLIANDPDTVKAFMAATSEGYEYAIAHPDEAADLLLKGAPDLDAKLVKASQEWISKQYQADASQWGIQKLEVYQGYADWMTEHKILTKPFDPAKAFTNDFLPGQGKGN